MFNDNSNLIL